MGSTWSFGVWESTVPPRRSLDSVVILRSEDVNAVHRYSRSNLVRLSAVYNKARYGGKRFKRSSGEASACGPVIMSRIFGP
jgi:hypothetical protein